MKKTLLVCLTFALLIITGIHKNVYSSDDKNKSENNTFETIYQQSNIKEGVKEITYDQFVTIRNSGDKYILLDARSIESYNKGHIDGAMSFPAGTINEENAKNRLTKDSKIIVYCGGFECHVSTAAAKKLSDLGYKVVDYKGGIKEWQEKGNKLIK